MVFGDDVRSATSNLTLNLGSGASAIFNSSQHLAGLNLTDGAAAALAAGGNKVLVTGALSLATGGRLDLADNDLIVDYDGATPLPEIVAALARGYAGGAWTGDGIGSSAAAADANHLTGLGYGDADAMGMTEFAGEVLDGTAVVIKYTYNGDSDLDGRITSDDLARVDLGKLRHRTGWAWGDSDFDDVIDAGDVGRVEAGMFLQGPGL
jgi:hypothetical protein